MGRRCRFPDQEAAIRNINIYISVRNPSPEKSFLLSADKLCIVNTLIPSGVRLYAGLSLSLIENAQSPGQLRAGSFHRIKSISISERFPI